MGPDCGLDGGSSLRKLDSRVFLPIARAVAATGTAPFHFLGYGVLAALLELAVGRGRFVALALAFTYGALLEGAQLAVPGRTASWTDLGINLAGALAGVSFGRLIRSAVSKMRPHSG